MYQVRVTMLQLERLERMLQIIQWELLQITSRRKKKRSRNRDQETTILISIHPKRKIQCVNLVVKLEKTWKLTKSEVSRLLQASMIRWLSIQKWKLLVGGLVLKSDQEWLEGELKVCQVQSTRFLPEGLKGHKFTYMLRLTLSILSRKRMFQVLATMIYRTQKIQDATEALHFHLEQVNELNWVEVKKVGQSLAQGTISKMQIWGEVLLGMALELSEDLK